MGVSVAFSGDGEFSELVEGFVRTSFAQVSHSTETASEAVLAEFIGSRQCRLGRKPAIVEPPDAYEAEIVGDSDEQEGFDWAPAEGE